MYQESKYVHVKEITRNLLDVEFEAQVNTEYQNFTNEDTQTPGT